MNFKSFMSGNGFFTEAFDRPQPVRWINRNDELWHGEFAVPVDGGDGTVRYNILAQIQPAAIPWLRQNTQVDAYDAGGPHGKGHYMMVLAFQRFSEVDKKWTYERPQEGEAKPQMSYVFATVLKAFKTILENTPKITAVYFVSYEDKIGDAKGSSSARFSVYQRLAARYAESIGLVRVPGNRPGDFLFVKKEYSMPKPLPPDTQPQTVMGKIGSMLGKPEPQPA